MSEVSGPFRFEFRTVNSVRRVYRETPLIGEPDVLRESTNDNGGLWVFDHLMSDDEIVEFTKILEYYNKHGELPE